MMTQQPARSRSRYFAQTLRIIGALLSIPPLITALVMATDAELSHAAWGFAATALTFGAMLWRTGTLIIKRVSVASETQGGEVDEEYLMRVWGHTSSAKVLGRLSTTALALVVVPTIHLFASMTPMMVSLMLGARRPPGAAHTFALVGAVFLSISVIGYLLGSRLGIWAAKQADLAKLDSQIIRRVATAHERQGGALSLDVQRGEHGGLTEIDAATGGLGVYDAAGDAVVFADEASEERASQHERAPSDQHAEALSPSTPLRKR